jgi:hypothetical protein
MDPRTFAISAVALTATAVVACWAPALKGRPSGPDVFLSYEKLRAAEHGDRYYELSARQRYEDQAVMAPHA